MTEIIIKYTAATAIKAGRFVNITSNGKITQSLTADAYLIGIAKGTSSAQQNYAVGDDVPVQIAGLAEIECSAALQAGSFVSTNASGQAKLASADANGTQVIGAQLLARSLASNDLVRCILVVSATDLENSSA